jgi:hypothetical protein
MEAGKSCDAYGSLSGHGFMLADVEQAYVQADFQGDATKLCPRSGRENDVAPWLSFGRFFIGTQTVAFYGVSVVIGHRAVLVMSPSQIGRRATSASVSNCSSLFTRAILSSVDSGDHLQEGFYLGCLHETGHCF